MNRRALPRAGARTNVPGLPGPARRPRRSGFRDDLAASFDAACRTVGWLAAAALGLLFLLWSYRMGEFLALAAGAIR